MTSAGQLGITIVRRMGQGKKIMVADWRLENADAIAKTLEEAGFDVAPWKVDISSKDVVDYLIEEAKKVGEISMFVNAAGVSPSQASIEQTLQVDLYGTAVLLKEFKKVIKEGGTGVTFSSQSEHRMPALTPEEDRLLATMPTKELLQLELLKLGNIKDTLHAYQMAKRCNAKQVMAEAVKWGERGARINSISPGIIITPLALDEINGPRGDFYKNMFAKSPAGRRGIADEVANMAELLLSDRGAFYRFIHFIRRRCYGILFLRPPSPIK